jgi:hypothetical protein
MNSVVAVKKLNLESLTCNLVSVRMSGGVANKRF